MRRAIDAFLPVAMFLLHRNQSRGGCRGLKLLRQLLRVVDRDVREGGRREGQSEGADQEGPLHDALPMKRGSQASGSLPTSPINL